MRRVAVASWATSKFVKQSEQTVFELACQPCAEILKNPRVDRADIDAVILSSCATDQYSSTIVSEMLGITPKASQRVDNLCNSGTNAIVTAYALIASGMCDLALVAGAEKADSAGSKLLWDVTRGAFPFPVHWAALFAKAHMRKYGTTEEDLALVAVKNRSFAEKNPNALFRSRVSVEEVMSSRMISDPLKLLDCSASCDGASAVLLASERLAKQITDSPVWITGIGQKTNSASFANATDDLTSVGSARQAARDAFQMSGTDPSRIDVAEVHDAFTIMEVLAMEDLGFRQKGVSSPVNESVVVNPRGGILGCGHPVGTTGVAQVAEIASQLAGKAGDRQVDGCKQGLVHNLAAAGSSATVMVLGS